MNKSQFLHLPRNFTRTAILVLAIAALVLTAACSPSGGQTSQADAEQGKALATQNGCLSCHSIDGSPMTGPTFLGLYGSQVTFQDGSTATADDAYLHQAIVDPAAKIVSGYEAVMPAGYGSSLKEEEISALIAFIKSLSK